MELQEITDEAVRIARDYPEMSFKEAIELAKEIIDEESIFKQSTKQH